MSKAEEFIESYTRKCSNEIDQLGADIAAFSEYHPWLTPDQAKMAVEIAREEVIDKLRKWIASKNERDSFTFGYINRHFDELLKQVMKDE